MKKYISIFIAAAFAAVSCTTDGTDYEPSSLTIEPVPAWDVTRGITSASQTVKVQVNLNVQTINWQVSSDSEWLKVDPNAVYTGSSELEMVVEANDAFDKRNAVLTFTAGLYTKKVEVDQAGNVFILSDVYKVMASNETETFDVEVRTMSDWTIETPEWIRAEKVGTPAVDEQGQTTTLLRVTVGANSDAEARYDAVQLVPPEGYNAEFTVFQFGTDVPMDENGNIAIPAEGNVSFDVEAPFGIIADVEAPYWVQCTQTDSEDGLHTKYNFWIGKNLSDTKTGRECVVKLNIKDSDASADLPNISQDFVPAGGIVTGLGFKMFAEAYNTGDDISYWASDSEGSLVVNVLSDVNMSEVESWTPIGTEARPFEGLFRGNGWLITDWKGDNSLFGYVGRNGTVQDIIVEENCTMTFSGAATAERLQGVFVSVLRGTLDNCVNRAPVSVANVNASAAMALGGVVGLLDGGTVRNSKNEAAITVAADVRSSAAVNIGGIVGKTVNEASTIEACSNSGAVTVNAKVSDSASLGVGGIAGVAAGKLADCSTGEKILSVSTDMSRNVYCGGIAGYSTAAVENCVNVMSVSNTLYRSGDAVYNEYTGGIVGYQELGSVKGCTNRGSLISSSNQQYLCLGGIAGTFANGEAENNVNLAKIDLQGDASAAIKGVRYAKVGGLYGSFNAAQGASDNDSKNSGPITVTNIESATNNSSQLQLGGIFGDLNSKTPVSSLSNSGNITVTLIANFNHFAIGGIAGATECGVSDSTNEGAVLLNNVAVIHNTAKIYYGGIAGWNNAGENNIYLKCVNNGELAVATKSTEVNVLPSFVGGILGYTEYPVTVKSCDNNGYVNNSGANNRYDGLFSSAGGIVGAIVDTPAEIDDCHSTANTRNYAYNRTVAMDKPNTMSHCGGVVGCALGESSSDIVRISNCSSTGVLENKRSTAAGIVGFAQYASVSDCRFTGRIIGSGPHFAGGIAGCLSNSTVTGCVVKSTDMYSHSGYGINNLNYFGVSGIAGYMYDNSSITDCKAFAVLIQNAQSTATPDEHLGMGLIGGITVPTATVSNCGLGGSFHTGGGGNAANLILTVNSDNFGTCIIGDGNASTSGCYYWNGQE
ncbi:MAG: BACON domain-containing protein [Alistipes sp.]|nr:BACON domain-containing protein [Alistipes sp.]